MACLILLLDFCHHCVHLFESLYLLLEFFGFFDVQWPVPLRVVDGLWLLLNLLSQKYAGVNSVVVWGCLGFGWLWLDWHFFLWICYFLSVIGKNFTFLCWKVFCRLFMWFLWLWSRLFLFVQIQKVCNWVFHREFCRYPASITCPVLIRLGAHCLLLKSL